MSSQLSKQIKTLRKSQGYSQKQLAELLDVKQATVANYERGNRSPDAGKLGMLAAIFKVSTDELLGISSIPNTINNILDNSIASIDSKQIINKVLNALLQSNTEEARNEFIATYHQINDLQIMYEDIMRPLLYQVGALWETGKVDVWMEHFISIFIQDMMSELKAISGKHALKKNKPSILAFTPGAEQHSIGLRMISDLLTKEGYLSYFLGSNVPMISAILAIEEKQVSFVLLSVTLPIHIESAKHVIEGIRSYFGKNSPKIMVGGNAFNDTYSWERTGADLYGASLDDILKEIKTESNETNQKGKQR